MHFRSQGSGFNVGSDGQILTYAPVARDAKEVMIKLSDRRKFKARMRGADSVLAIGSPVRFEQTVTHGIGSAKDSSPS